MQGLQLNRISGFNTTFHFHRPLAGRLMKLWLLIARNHMQCPHLPASHKPTLNSDRPNGGRSAAGSYFNQLASRMFPLCSRFNCAVKGREISSDWQSVAIG
jgi:hypothetical protein